MPSAPFPRLEAYVDSLNGKLDAYPSHRQKASIYRMFIKELADADELAQQLPEPLADLVRSPRLPSSWVPEVHVTALYLALADRDGLSDDGIEALWLRFNRALFESPLYRFMMKVVSPQWMIKGVDKRWGTFHQGVTLAMTEIPEHGAHGEMEFPRHLVPGVIARGYGAAFHAAVEAAGGRNVSIELAEHDSSHATYALQWQ